MLEPEKIDIRPLGEKVVEDGDVKAFMDSYEKNSSNENYEESTFPEPIINLNIETIKSLPDYETIESDLTKAVLSYYNSFYVSIIGMLITSERLKYVEEAFKNVLISGLSPYLDGIEFGVKVACNAFEQKTRFGFSCEVRFNIDIEIY